MAFTRAQVAQALRVDDSTIDLLIRSGHLKPSPLVPEDERRRVRSFEAGSVWNLADWIDDRPSMMPDLIAWLDAKSIRLAGRPPTRIELRRGRRRKGCRVLSAVEQRVAYYGNRCWMCDGPFEEIDHVIPVARGGFDWASNLRPACSRCNRSKGARPFRRPPRPRRPLP